jgi:hypothetical protein
MISLCHADSMSETYLEDMTPVLALVIEPLVHHFHNLDKVAPTPLEPSLAYMSE